MTLIHVQGRDVELVPVDQLTLDEAIVLYDWSKLTLDQIPDLEGFHPGFVAALIHIAVARAYPDQQPAEIRRLVGGIPISDLEQVFAGISEEVDNTSVPPPDATNNAGSSSGSGDSSAPTGEPAPASNPGNGSGSPGLATGATSDPATWGR